jgi:hypothetical protein
MSAFLNLSDAVKAALMQAPALASGNVRRGRRLPVPTDQAQSIDIHVQRSSADNQFLSGGMLRWDTLVAIDLYARASAGTDGETAIDGLLASVFTRMAAATPPPGVIGWVLEPAIQWDIDEADQTLAQASVALRVSHFTTTDLAAAA